MYTITESRSPTFLKALIPYQWILSFFGLALPPPLMSSNTSCRSRLVTYSIFAPYCFFLTLSSVVTAYQHNEAIIAATKTYHLDCITGVLSFKQNWCIAAVAILSCIRSFYNRHNVLVIDHMIDEIQLEMEKKCSGNFRSSHVKWRLLKVSGIWLIVMTIGLIYINCNIIASSLATANKIITIFSVMAAQLKCIECDIYLQIVQEFLQCLENSLSCLIKEIDMFHYGEEQIPWSLSRRLVSNQILLNRIWLLVNRLERYFAWPLILLFYSNSVATLSTINWAYVRSIYAMEQYNQIYRVGFILILLTNLFVLCSLTERCKQKYESIALIVHSIKTKPQDVALRMRVREYSLQMKHQKLIFTCNGYMDIDYKNFGKILLVIIAYMVILVQFKLEDVHLGTKIATQHIFGTHHK